MKHKRIHYVGYFLLALVFVFTGVMLATFQDFQVFPLFFVGIIFWSVGCVKVAQRNVHLKDNANH